MDSKSKRAGEFIDFIASESKVGPTSFKTFNFLISHLDFLKKGERETYCSVLLRDPGSISIFLSVATINWIETINAVIMIVVFCFANLLEQEK